MPLDRDNLILGPVENLRTLIASSEAFQALVGVVTPDLGPAGVDQAKTHIYYPAIAAADIRDARPFALIMGHLNEPIERQGVGAYLPSGEMAFAFEFDVPAEHLGETTAKYADAEAWFTRLLGEIVEDMLITAGLGTVLEVKGITLAQPIERSEPAAAAAEGHFYRAILTVRWGGGNG